jgi:hypothetical protein
MQLFATTPLEQHEATYSRRWWVLAALCLSLLLVLMANTTKSSTTRPFPGGSGPWPAPSTAALR